MILYFHEKNITKKNHLFKNYLLGEIAQHMPDEQNDQSFQNNDIVQFHEKNIYLRMYNPKLL